MPSTQPELPSMAEIDPPTYPARREQRALPSRPTTHRIPQSRETEGILSAPHFIAAAVRAAMARALSRKARGGTQRKKKEITYHAGNDHFATHSRQHPAPITPSSAICRPSKTKQAPCRHGHPQLLRRTSPESPLVCPHLLWSANGTRPRSRVTPNVPLGTPTRTSSERSRSRRTGPPCCHPGRTCTPAGSERSPHTRDASTSSTPPACSARCQT